MKLTDSGKPFIALWKLSPLINSVNLHYTDTIRPSPRVDRDVLSISLWGSRSW